MVLGSVVEQLRLDVERATELLSWSWVSGLARRYRGEQPNSASVFSKNAWGGERLSFGDLRLPE